MNNQIKYTSHCTNSFKFISWYDLDQEIKKLFYLLQLNKQTDCTIIGLFQGGWIIAQILADYYPDAKILGATWTKNEDFYFSSVINTQDDSSIDCSTYIKNKNIILVDEVSESGKTFISHTNSLLRYSPKNIITCSLFSFKSSKFKPSIVVNEINNSTNFIFPWRIKRDFSYFLEAYIKEHVLSSSEMQNFLSKKHNIQLSIEFIENEIQNFIKKRDFNNE